MDCRQIGREDLVEKYLQGRLVGAAQDDFEVHILECERCLQAMEVLGAVRDDLAQRAHEIRLLPAPGPVQFRWRWLAVACGLVVVCGLGVIQVRKAYTRHGTVAATTPKTSPPSNVAQSHELQTDVAKSIPEPGLSPSQREKGVNVPRTLAKSAPPLTTTPSGPSGQEPGKAQESAKPEVATATATSPESGGHSIPTNEDKREVAVHPPEPGKKPELVSDEVEAELFRLGTVQAPPYVFSGVASTKLGSEKSAHGSGLSSGSKPSGGAPQRAAFQSAMLAYVEGRYRDAAGLLENEIESEPKAPDANLYLGICRLLLGRPADSIAPLRTALEKDKSPFAQSAHFYLAKAYIQVRDLGEAEAQLEAAASMPGRLRAEANAELTRLRALRAQ